MSDLNKSLLIEHELKEINLLKDPFLSFENWFSMSKKSNQVEPEAMVVSSVSSCGKPNSRVVLLKQFENSYDGGRFYFFTNYNSIKGKELISNGSVAVNFHWREPKHRQIRILANVVKCDRVRSEQYFETRPRGSQIAAYTSDQSSVVSSKKEMVEILNKNLKQFSDLNKTIPCPENWGGFEVTPYEYEFWQEGEHRYHDRFKFVLSSSLNSNLDSRLSSKNEKPFWVIKRLFP